MILNSLVQRARNLLSPYSLVLMYHRVIEIEIDPWQLAVSRFNFEEQLKVLKRTGLVAPLTKVLGHLDSSRKPTPAIFITFDDGYADNYLHAKPLLEKYNLPATFFISSNHIGKATEFWWDELARLLLLSEVLPSEVTLNITGTRYSFDLKGEELLTPEIKQKHKDWNAYMAPTTSRSSLYIKLWQLLTLLSYQEQQNQLNALKSLLSVVEPTPLNNISISVDQLRSLSACKLFTVGAHTVSHPMLSNLSKENQEIEITENKSFLETITDQNIYSFAYPSGNYNDETVEVLREQQFKIAFTTKQNSVRQGNVPFSIGRFQVNNWSGTEFTKIISKW